ncbi:MAG: LLM class F420-dependent oxidoreductase [Acidimicrobiia bacterium]|nr:LLM class F420-dependent oxidoreductase [Acidimicrobiia bacterium]
MFPTDKAIGPIELAKEAEARGFESLWFPEHSHIPSSRQTPWGGREGAPPLPEEYWRTHDQFVALGAAAAVTSTIKLGTGITLVAQRDPIWLAKEVATVDALSNGRMLLGIGYGWNKEELADHGVRYTQRRAVVRESVLAMKELWTKDEAEFHGEFVNFEKSWQWPKPTQKPHPPVILGGAAGPRTIADIVEFCDGFMPTSGRYDFAAQIAQIRRAAEDAGRDPGSIEFGQFGTPAKPEIVDSLVEAGCTRIVLGLPPAAADKVLPLLDSYAAFAGSYAS